MRCELQARNCPLSFFFQKSHAARHSLSYYTFVMANNRACLQNSIIYTLSHTRTHTGQITLNSTMFVNNHYIFKSRSFVSRAWLFEKSDFLRVSNILFNMPDSQSYMNSTEAIWNKYTCIGRLQSLERKDE